MNHVKNECVRRLVLCQFCDQLIAYQDEFDHAVDCGQFPIAYCPMGCNKKNILRREVGDIISMHKIKDVAACRLVLCILLLYVK